ncbi:MAG: HNH endonuclease [Nanoarchaeota archaeon]|nr:HNH endonuclease [Nanoarchaeota archaeon]
MSKTKIPNKLRAEILNRDSNKCLWCGRDILEGIKLEVDHIQAESFGGLTTQENLGTLCNECNNGKNNNYYGNYLLMTLIKIPNFENRICFEILKEGNAFDNTKFRYFLTFFKKNKDNYYRLESIYQDFEVEGELGYIDKSNSAMIQLDLAKKENLLKFKNKIRDFLIDNKGYLEELNGRIIFQEKK